MLSKVIRPVKSPVSVAVILLCLAGIVFAASGNIDPTEKWAWGTNVGWVNFAADDHHGITVYSDHLEGYAWAENVGWIRLGTYEGGGTHAYANDGPNTYGVNNDGMGNLSGYAWGTNVGWVNFAPDGGGVTIDPDTGSFDGYAWGENIGWISFSGTGEEPYNVVTDWRASHYTLNLAIVGEGNVYSDPKQDTYNHGDVVTLTPAPDPGWTFDGWSGPDAGDLSDQGNGSWDLVMDDDKSVTATFTELPPGEYTLTVDTVGKGSVALHPAGGVYEEGDVVELTAEADPGWEFSRWSGDLSGDANPESIVMDSNKTVTAVFIGDRKSYLPLVVRRR